MPSNHLILCHSLLLLPSIFPSIRVFSNESALKVRLIYSRKTMLQFKENNSHLYWHLGTLAPSQNFACVFRSNHKHLPSWETPWRKTVFPTPDWVQSQCTPSKMLVAQLCPTLCDPHGPTRLLCPWNSSGKNTGVGCHFLSPGDLPNPGTEPGSLALQVDSLLSKPPGKPHINIKFY